MTTNWTRRKLGAYRRNAKRRRIAFLLPESRALSLFRGQCYYCGGKPHENPQKLNPGAEPLNGIDRMDSKKGYLEGNCVSCCFVCNWMKGVIDLNLFVQQCRKIAWNQMKKEIAPQTPQNPRELITCHPQPPQTSSSSQP